MVEPLMYRGLDLASRDLSRRFTQKIGSNAFCFSSLSESGNIPVNLLITRSGAAHDWLARRYKGVGATASKRGITGVNITSNELSPLFFMMFNLGRLSEDFWCSLCSRTCAVGLLVYGSTAECSTACSSARPQLRMRVLRL